MRKWTQAIPLGLLMASALVALAASPWSAAEFAPESQWLPPSLVHPFGCGELGVDLLALTSSAILRSLALAGAVAAAGFAIGAPLGAGAALLEGRVERFVERSCDLVQAFPSFLLAMVVLSATSRPTRLHLGLVLLISAWAPFARLSLTQARVIRDSTFVSAATALGSSRLRVVFRHLLPNVIPVTLVQLGSTAASLVVSEASLAFVGLGPRDGVSLGQLIDQGTVTMFRAPHVLVVGCAALFVTSGALLLALRPGGSAEQGQP